MNEKTFKIKDTHKDKVYEIEAETLEDAFNMVAEKIVGKENPHAFRQTDLDTYLRDALSDLEDVTDGEKVEVEILTEKEANKILKNLK